LPFAVCALAGALISAAAPGKAVAVAAGAPAATAPRLVPAFEGLLDGVVATSATNAWAVGDDAGNTLIVHWNGKAWKKVAAPNPDPKNDTLVTMAAVSASDIWSVGNLGGNALVVHWNGRAWRLVRNPTFKGGASLQGVAAVSTANVWAVGSSNYHPLTEHWNGRKWQRVPLPASVPASSDLTAVAATSARDVWAVGDYFYGTNGSGVLILHWNGKAWRRVAAPVSRDSDMIGVTALSATNAWAVGDYTIGGGLTLHTLIEHWDGKAWRKVPSYTPNQGASLWAVAAKSPSLAFAVGSTDSTLFTLGNTFLMKWNGHVWREVTSPTPFNGLMFGVTFGSKTSAFAVGTNDALGYNPNGWTLIEHWNGRAWG
jgi:hypothetical protein